MDHHAPEVFHHGDDAPIPVDGYSQLEHYPEKMDGSRTQVIPVSTTTPYRSPDLARSSSAKYEPMTLDAQRATSRRQRWCNLWALAAAIGMLCTLGGGIGIGYAVGHKSSMAPSSVTPTANASSSPPATSSAVTSGYTGITAFTCNNTSSYSSPYAAMFTEECQKSYIAGQPSYTSDSTLLVANLFGLTVYTFEACMDECAKRNLQFTYSDAYPLNGTRCGAVSYYADLTASVGAWRGNCFLKNVRGVAANGNGPVNASLTASAYLTTT